MNKDELIKQNKQCMNALGNFQKRRLQSIDSQILELHSEIGILNKEIAIIIKEQAVRKLEAERRELEKNLI